MKVLPLRPYPENKLSYINCMKIIWSLKSFEELTPLELYKIMRLRIEVFVVEQNCAFQDADNKDQSSWHQMGWRNEELVAYARIMPPGLVFRQGSIGRVVSSPAVRGEGIGMQLMQESIESVYRLFGKSPIQIGAQFYLKKFYELLGFVRCSEIYQEDGIDHIHMLKD
jgi:ElaA protein